MNSRLRQFLQRKASPSLNIFFSLFLVFTSSFSSVTIYQYSVINAQEPVEYEELPLDMVSYLESQQEISPSSPLETEPSQEKSSEQSLIELNETKAIPETISTPESTFPPQESDPLIQQDSATDGVSSENLQAVPVPEADLPAVEQSLDSSENPIPENLSEQDTSSPQESVVSENPSDITDSETLLPEEGQEEVVSPDEVLLEEVLPENEETILSFFNEDEKKTIWEGELKLLPDSSTPLDTSEIRLAQVNLPGKQEGETLTLDEALVPLVGLSTTEEDLKKLLLRSLLEEDSQGITEKILEDRTTKKALDLNANTGLFQGLSGKVEEVVQLDPVQKQLAEKLENEPEVDMFFDTLLTPEFKQDLVQDLVEEAIHGGQEVSVVASESISEDYERLALNQLIAESINKNYEAQVVLEQAVSQSQVDQVDSKEEILTVTAKGPSGLVNIPLNQIHFKAGSVVMELETRRQFAPGLYRFEIEIKNPVTEEKITLIQDLAWGVIAMNPDRDRYQGGERADIAIGVLNDQGQPVCNAQVTLQVITPQGEVDWAEVINTGQCNTLDSMNVEPDYLAHYRFNQPGDYQLNVTATQANGEKRTHSNVIQVGSFNYTVERKAATRLYPVGLSPMTIQVHFHNSFQGSITDILPADFEVPEIDQGGVLTAQGGEKHVTWTVEAAAGEIKTFSYRYDSPDISPEFFTLGPLRGGGNLLENRRWEIANDEPVIAQDSTLNLKGHWKFNEGVGTTAADSSSYGSTATLNNMEPSDWINTPPSVVGNAFAVRFNATNENLSVPDPVDGHLDFGNLDDFTITGWFNRSTFTTTDVIVAKKNDGASASVGYFVYLPSSDQLIFEISDGVDEYTLNSSTLFTAVGWNHFAIVWDQDSAANTEIYINGIDNNAIDTGIIANIGSAANALQLRMGAESDAGNGFDGAIDDIRIYSSALSASEIQVLAGSITAPVVTDANISINTGSGTGGAFKVGDQVVATWNNSAGGDNNSGLTAVTANLSGWGGSATATMTDTAACGGTAGNNIYEACFTLVSGSIDAVNVNASVTATNIAGSTTTADTSNATVDNQAPFFVDNGTLTITTDNGVAAVAALNNGVSNQDQVTQSAVTLAVNDSDTSTINLSALTGQATLALGTQSGVLIPGTLDSATQTFTITSTDNAGNVSTTPSDSISVDNQVPTVTAANISVTGATGSGGAFKSGDSATGRWDNSGAGDNNPDIISVSFNLSDFRSADSALAGTGIANIWTASISGALDSQGDVNNNTSVTVTDDGGNTKTTTGTNNYTVDTLFPSISSITSVAGDSTAPYVDTTDDSSTQIIFVSADTGTGISACRWSSSNVAYASMVNNCASTSSCTSTLAGEGAKTVYLACIDGAGNSMPTNTQVDYTVQVPDVTPPSGTSITPNSLRIINSDYPSFTVSDGTDSESGIDPSSRLLERADAPYTNNTCGSFGSFSPVTPTGTYPNFSDATVTGSGCYKYRYSVSDNAANTSTTPETSVIVRVPFTTLSVTGGDNQSYGDSTNNPIGHTLATPLQVRVTDGGSNWALVGEITVDFAITATPSSPAATGQNLSVSSDATDANGYAETSLTLGDRAGNYQVQATSLHSSIVVEPTFTATAGQYFDVNVVETNLSLFLDPLALPADYASPTVTVVSNASSYELHLAPNQWPNSGIDQILNWVGGLGIGWSLNLGAVNPFSELLGNPASTLVYSCSGDSCQAPIIVDVDLHAAIDFLNPPGTYTHQIYFTGENLNY